MIHKVLLPHKILTHSTTPITKESDPVPDIRTQMVAQFLRSLRGTFDVQVLSFVIGTLSGSIMSQRTLLGLFSTSTIFFSMGENLVKVAPINEGTALFDDLLELGTLYVVGAAYFDLIIRTVKERGHYIQLSSEELLAIRATL